MGNSQSNTKKDIILKDAEFAEELNQILPNFLKVLENQVAVYNDESWWGIFKRAYYWPFFNKDHVREMHRMVSLINNLNADIAQGDTKMCASLAKLRVGSKTEYTRRWFWSAVHAIALGCAWQSTYERTIWDTFIKYNNQLKCMSDEEVLSAFQKKSDENQRREGKLDDEIDDEDHKHDEQKNFLEEARIRAANAHNGSSTDTPDTPPPTSPKTEPKNKNESNGGGNTAKTKRRFFEGQSDESDDAPNDNNTGEKKSWKIITLTDILSLTSKRATNRNFNEQKRCDMTNDNDEKEAGCLLPSQVTEPTTYLEAQQLLQINSRDDEAIKKAYKQLARQWHPDKHRACYQGQDESEVHSRLAHAATTALNKAVALLAKKPSLVDELHAWCQEILKQEARIIEKKELLLEKKKETTKLKSKEIDFVQQHVREVEANNTLLQESRRKQQAAQEASEAHELYKRIHEETHPVQQVTNNLHGLTCYPQHFLITEQSNIQLVDEAVTWTVYYKNNHEGVPVEDNWLVSLSLDNQVNLLCTVREFASLVNKHRLLATWLLHENMLSRYLSEFLYADLIRTCLAIRLAEKKQRRVSKAAIEVLFDKYNRSGDLQLNLSGYQNTSAIDVIIESYQYKAIKAFNKKLTLIEQLKETAQTAPTQTLIQHLSGLSELIELENIEFIWGKYHDLDQLIGFRMQIICNARSFTWEEMQEDLTDTDTTAQLLRWLITLSADYPQIALALYQDSKCYHYLIHTHQTDWNNALLTPPFRAAEAVFQCKITIEPEYAALKFLMAQVLSKLREQLRLYQPTAPSGDALIFNRLVNLCKAHLVEEVGILVNGFKTDRQASNWRWLRYFSFCPWSATTVEDETNTLLKHMEEEFSQRPFDYNTTVKNLSVLDHTVSLHRGQYNAR